MSISPLPRINGEIVKEIQFIDQATIGDWYCYQNYTEIRVFRYELPTYKLPKYLPIRIFALEYLRQSLNADEVNFLATKKKSQFKLKAQVGPFICNTRVAGEEVDKLLKELKFSLSFSWSYDPLGVISKLTVENKFTPYPHTTRPKIEQFMNQLEWTENTLQEADEQVISTSNMQTPIAQEKTAKRGR